MTSTLTGASWAGPVDLPLGGELDVQAACGLMHVHGRRFGRPTALGLDYASILAAELVAVGASALGVGRLRGVPLRRVSTSVAQAALLAVSPYLAAATAGEAGAAPAGVGGPPFLSSDGVAFEVEAPDLRVWRRFWGALEVGSEAVEAAWRASRLRFATATCPLPPEVTGGTARVPIARLERVAASTGSTLVRVARRAVDDLPPYVVRPLGQGAGSVGGAPGAGVSPLSGVVVLEACGRVRGPLAGHLLGQLGASVVRVEPPGGDPERGAPEVSARFHALNRGKRVVEVDVGTVGGRAALRELVSGADVFLHDWAAGEAASRGLRDRDVERVRPGVVYAHASEWGDAFGARPPLGAEFVVQARAGVPPSLMAIVDVFGGAVCARGVVDAIGRRIRSGFGQSVASSSLSAASRLNARATRRCVAPLGVEVCTDLAELARDPRFSRALVVDGCVVPAPVWEFG